MIRSKVIRLIAASLMLLAAALNFICLPEASGECPLEILIALSMGLLITGMLIFVRLKYLPLLGLIFSLTGLVAGLFYYGADNANLLVGLLFYTDGLAIIFCAFLVIHKMKGFKNQT